MSDSGYRKAFVESIFHPSDFSGESDRAFAHALAIALREKTSLTVLNAGVGDKRKRWSNFPSVRATLERWKILEQGGSRTAVFKELDVRVKKVSLQKRRPLSAVLEYLDDNPTDLIVVATQGREGLPRWLRPSMAEGIARGSETKTLFVPNSATGFVSLDDGRIDLKKILVAVDRHPDSSFAVSYAAAIAGMSETTAVEIIMLDISGKKIVSTINQPDSPGCTWTTREASGDAVESIVKTAEQEAVDLIVMATEGPEGILGTLKGSQSDHVVRRAPCAVLAVPTRHSLFP